MKKFLLTLSLLLGSGLATFPGYAQPPINEPAGDHARLRAALQEIGLSPRQKVSIARVLKEGKASGLDRRTMLEQVGAVLTPGQKAQLAEKLKAASKP